jgi:hypothetical protein
MSAVRGGLKKNAEAEDAGSVLRFFLGDLE